MVTDREIWRRAQEMVKRHGINAPLHAAAQADELRAAGDAAGVAVWAYIRRACEVLLRAPAPERGDTVH